MPFPVPLNTHMDLACEITGYYPQSVSVVWKWHSPGVPQKVLLETWESGHRQAPDGTYSFTSFARLPAVQPGDQGGSYSCHVSHTGLGQAGLQKSLKLNVAGRPRGGSRLHVGDSGRGGCPGLCEGGGHPPLGRRTEGKTETVARSLEGVHAPTQSEGGPRDRHTALQPPPPPIWRDSLDPQVGSVGVHAPSCHQRQPMNLGQPPPK